MSINPACKRENCTTIGWHVHRDGESLSERIARFQANDSILRRWQDSDAFALAADCQAEIARLTDRVQLFEDAKYPEEIARLDKLASGISEDFRAAQKLLSELIHKYGFVYDENGQLKTQLERAEALLRRCSSIRFTGSAINQDIAAYFRENQKP